MSKPLTLLLIAATFLTSCGSGSRELAAPADVPAGFESLELTVDQARQLNVWLTKQKPSPDPVEIVKYLDSLLRSDQKGALEDLLKSTEQTDPNAPPPEGSAL